MISVGGFWKLPRELAASDLQFEGKRITWTAVLSSVVSLQEEQVQALVNSLLLVQPTPLSPAGLRVWGGAR